MSDYIAESGGIATQLMRAASQLSNQAEAIRREASWAMNSLPNSSSCNQERHNCMICFEALVNNSESIERQCSRITSQCRNLERSMTHRNFDYNEMLQQLAELHSLSDSLHGHYRSLKDSAKQAKRALDGLVSQCHQEANDARSRALQTRVGGGVGTGLAAGGSVVLAVLGFIFPPLLIGSAALGATAAAGGVATGIGASNLDDEAESFDRVRSSLQFPLLELDTIGERIREMSNATAVLIEQVRSAEHSYKSKSKSDRYWRN